MGAMGELAPKLSLFLPLSTYQKCFVSVVFQMFLHFFRKNRNECCQVINHD